MFNNSRSRTFACVLLLVGSLQFSCRPADPDVATPRDAANDPAVQTPDDELSTPLQAAVPSLTAQQKQAIRQIKEAGGRIELGESGPQLIDLATGRVYADDALVRSLAEFPRLQRLRLTAANTTTEAFAALESLVQLTELYLQDAPLDDQAITKTLAAMPRLERLTLRRLADASDEVVSALVKCKRLRVLALIEMNISGDVLPELKHLSSLRSLDLRSCGQLAGEDFQKLMLLDQLTELKIGGPAVTDQVLVTVAQHPNITSLAVEDAEVSGNCLEPLALQSALAARLRSLSLARCFGVSDETLSVLSQFPQLQSLSLRGIFVTGSFLTALSEAEPAAPPLMNLTVIDGFLDDASLTCLPGVFPALVRLELSGNAGITYASVPVFDKLTNLESLQLQRTGVSESAAARVGK
jgi:hypothetical protein